MVVSTDQLLESALITALGGPNQRIDIWTHSGPYRSGCLMGHKPLRQRLSTPNPSTCEFGRTCGQIVTFLGRNVKVIYTPAA